jgi:hypothetical protein
MAARKTRSTARKAANPRPAATPKPRSTARKAGAPAEQGSRSTARKTGAPAEQGSRSTARKAAVRAPEEQGARSAARKAEAPVGQGARGTARQGGNPGLTFDTVRDIALALPGMEEGTAYGTPAFRVGKKFIARLHPDGESLVLKVDPEAREVLTRAEPETFYFTEHYAGYPEYLLVRMSKVRRDVLAKLLEESWRMSASKRHLAGRP